MGMKEERRNRIRVYGKMMGNPVRLGNRTYPVLVTPVTENQQSVPTTFTLSHSTMVFYRSILRGILLFGLSLP